MIAAVNVAVHASRWSIDAIHDDLLPRLLRATAAIDADVLMAPAAAFRSRRRAPHAAGGHPNRLPTRPIARPTSCSRCSAGSQ